MKIKITTDRLPQPDRHLGSTLEVTSEKAHAMVAQGFAEIIEEPLAPITFKRPDRVAKK
jgi:hypothetical protein